MFSENASRIIVRDAESSDVPMLTAIKADGSQDLHRDVCAMHGMEIFVCL